jgi:thiol peroxidase
MALERVGLIQFDGADRTVVGPDLKPGDPAPDFVAIGQDWSELHPLKAGAGKVIVLAAVLSLETSVCDREIRRFNTEASSLGPDVQVYVISTDLPFTLKRSCVASGIDRVTTLSDQVHADFGPRYGCWVKEMRVLRRAVFVIGRDGKLTYVDYMKVFGDEPRYEDVLAAAKKAL